MEESLKARRMKDDEIRKKKYGGYENARKFGLQILSEEA